MSQFYSKKYHIVCFEAKELERMIFADWEEKLHKELAKRGFTIADLYGNQPLMEEISDKLVSENKKHKEDIEFFIAWESCLTFFDQGGQICFYLRRGFDIYKTPIKTLVDLKKAAEEYNLTDFGIMLDSGFRQFQLKQYTHELTTDALFDEICIRLKKYGNDLGDVNLLMVLQGNGSGTMNIDFKELNQRLAELNLSHKGQILIQYNELNKFEVINEVYPNLGTCRKEFTPKNLYSNL